MVHRNWRILKKKPLSNLCIPNKTWHLVLARYYELPVTSSNALNDITRTETTYTPSSGYFCLFFPCHCAVEPEVCELEPARALDPRCWPKGSKLWDKNEWCQVRSRIVLLKPLSKVTGPYIAVNLEGKDVTVKTFFIIYSQVNSWLKSWIKVLCVSLSSGHVKVIIITVITSAITGIITSIITTIITTGFTTIITSIIFIRWWGDLRSWFRVPGRFKWRL